MTTARELPMGSDKVNPMNVSLDAGLADHPLPERRSFELPAALSMAVAVILAVSFVVGMRSNIPRPYDASVGGLPPFFGQDAVNLVVGLPMLVGAMRLARRGSLAGLLLWMGTLFHVAYSHAFYVLGARSASLLPVSVAVVSMSMYALIDLLVDVDADAVKAAFGARAPARLVGGFLATAAVLFVSLRNADIAVAITSAPVSRLIGALDGVITLATLFCSGVLLWRRRPWGFVLAGILLPRAAFFGVTRVATTAIAALHGVRIDPVATAGFLMLGAVGLALTVRYLRSIERSAASLPALGS